MALPFNDFWDRDGNAEKYQHVVPQMIHKLQDGRSVAWDTGNKGFRFLNSAGTDFQGSPNELPKRKVVEDTDFIQAYYAERSNNGSLESLIKALGYYKNNLQGLRARISDVNKSIKLAILKNLGTQKGNEAIEAQRDNPTMCLYGLKSAHTLRGAPRGEGADLEGIWNLISAQK